MAEPLILERGGNLYDSVLNEIEKIEAYTKAISQLDNLESKVRQHPEVLSDLTDDEISAYSFILIKRNEIMMNKYISSYFAISYAIERHHYRMLNKAYGHCMVKYYPDIYKLFYAVVDHITVCKSHALRDNDELARDCVKGNTHREVVDHAWEAFSAPLREGKFDPIVVVSHDFEKVFSEAYEKGRRLIHILNRDITTTSSEYQALIISKCIMRLTMCVIVNELSTTFID